MKRRERRINRVFPKDQREHVIATMAGMRRLGYTYGECARKFDRDVSNTRKQVIAWERNNAERTRAEPLPMEQGAASGEVSYS